MQKRGLQPEVVQLAHNTEGYWLGNKNAKNVIVYYHGTYPPCISTPLLCNPGHRSPPKKRNNLKPNL